MLILLSYIRRRGYIRQRTNHCHWYCRVSYGSYVDPPTRYTRMGPALTCSLVSSLLGCWTTVPLFSVLLELAVLEVLTLLMLLVLLCFIENVFAPAPEFEWVSKSSSSLACFRSSSSCLWARMSCRRVVSWNICENKQKCFPNPSLIYHKYIHLSGCTLHTGKRNWWWNSPVKED